MLGIYSILFFIFFHRVKIIDRLCLSLVSAAEIESEKKQEISWDYLISWTARITVSRVEDYVGKEKNLIAQSIYTRDTWEEGG